MKKIFVGNLEFGATEDAVRSLFETYGTVDSVRIMTDRDTGRSRGFAFVEMGDSAEAERAITSLNGRELGGRALNVNEARPKPEGSGGGGGGFGNRSRSGGGGGGGRPRREPRW
ncbi:MAG TPA: RNA-binding protein [Bryobacteraceae bacterium]|nr:RNA-binding protein [Bryobacteraceae bacterium]